MPEQPEQSATRPALFTLSEAATACGVSRSRIRRMLDAGEFPNAVREEVPGKGSSAAPWYIPAPDLLAAGLVPNRPTDGSGQDGEQSANSPGQAMADEVEGLRVELALERERRFAAEGIARERERAIEALEMALRLLEAGRDATTPREGLDGPPAGDRGEDTTTAPEGPEKPAHGVESGGDAPAGWWERFRRRF